MSSLPNQSEMHVDVIVCTFRRPALLARLIDAIAAQHSADWRLRLIVVDNDPLQSAQTVLTDAMACHPSLTSVYLSEPRKNIALARNAGLDTSDADYIAFIDDDECPSPDWLSRLLSSARDFNAGLVFGPVLPEYHADTPDWLINGGFFDRPRHATGTPLPLAEARTGNVLIRADLIQTTGLRFDPDFGLSGGEDSVFFRSLYPLAGNAIWCDEAIVHEAIPPERSTARWLLRRRFRIGSVEACMAKQKMDAMVLARVVLKSCYLCLRTVVECLPAALCSQACLLQSMRRGAIGAGLIYGLLFGVFNEYK